MKSNFGLLSLVCLFFASMLSANEAEDIDNVTMEITTKENVLGNRIRMPAREIVLRMMIRNGDITVEEIEKRKKEKEAQRLELKQLKESGDNKEYLERLNDMKNESRRRREELREYMENTRDQKQNLRDEKKNQRDNIKEEQRERQRERREQRREKLKER